MGMPVDAEGVNHGEDLNLACRTRSSPCWTSSGERGFSARAGLRDRERGGRPRISNVVDVPNVVVSALLPEDIFQD